MWQGSTAVGAAQIGSFEELHRHTCASAGSSVCASPRSRGTGSATLGLSVRGRQCPLPKGFNRVANRHLRLGVGGLPSARLEDDMMREMGAWARAAAPLCGDAADCTSGTLIADD